MAHKARHRTALLLVLALAGCGQSVGGIAGGGRVIGKTVTVYSVTTAPADMNRDFVDGEKLALADAHGRAGTLAVNFTSLDLGTDAEDAAVASRRAINDPQIIATIADATDVTVPLFNAAGILMVAPGGEHRAGQRPARAAAGPEDRGAAGRDRGRPRGGPVELRRELQGELRPRPGARRREGLPGHAERPGGDQRRPARPATTAST